MILFENFTPPTRGAHRPSTHMPQQPTYSVSSPVRPSIHKRLTCGPHPHPLVQEAPRTNKLSVGFLPLQYASPRHVSDWHAGPTRRPTCQQRTAQSSPPPTTRSEGRGDGPTCQVALPSSTLILSLSPSLPCPQFLSLLFSSLSQSHSPNPPRPERARAFPPSPPATSSRRRCARLPPEGGAGGWSP